MSEALGFHRAVDNDVVTLTFAGPLNDQSADLFAAALQADLQQGIITVCDLTEVTTIGDAALASLLLVILADQGSFLSRIILPRSLSAREALQTAGVHPSLAPRITIEHGDLSSGP